MYQFTVASLIGSPSTRALRAAVKSVLFLICLGLSYQTQAQITVIVEDMHGSTEEVPTSSWRAHSESGVELSLLNRKEGLSNIFFNVYPTPTDEVLHLAVYAPAVLQAFDIQDENQQSLFYCSSPSGSISVPTLGPGSYYMVVHTNQGSARKPFTVIE